MACLSRRSGRSLYSGTNIRPAAGHYKALALTKRASMTPTSGSSGLLARTFVEITGLYLLVVPTLWACKRTHLSRPVSGDDGGLIPVEDVAARLAPLAEGHDRAALANDLATRHLYRHLAPGRVACPRSFLSSSLATAARWTSSGPSARRRVRALAQR